MSAQFLPLCDVFFNLISLAGYFCDLVFDLVFGYALLARGKTAYFAIVIALVAFSLVISQIVSLKLLRKERALGVVPSIAVTDQPQSKLQAHQLCNNSAKTGRYIVLIHFMLCGVLWRYAKLFVPVDLRNVKHEVRDLCMLRLVHAFCEGAPMLLLQLHVLVSIQAEDQIALTQELRMKSLGSSSIIPQSVPASTVFYQQNRTFKDLNTISAILSLFSVCWALASFSKNVRLQNVHRLVLTWLGVIFQFLWRLGTVISRVTSLTVYASLYNHWIFLVIILHWTSMLLWLISPKNVFHGEKISRMRKTVLAALISFIYIFAYINLQEVNHRQKMFTFYIVMFLENLLLVCLWTVGIWSDRPDRWYFVPVTVLSSFCIGIFFMVIYYKYFHVRRLGYESGGRVPDGEDFQTKCCSMAKTKHCKCRKQSGCMGNYIGNEKMGTKYHPPAIPGVFNCRFTNPVNGATKRKKKKPTTFVPPPNLRVTTQQQQLYARALINGQVASDQLNHPLEQIIGPMSPFWKRQISLSQTGSSENESSVGSHVNIQQKLQEKKQKQLAELRVIEEEIKQGKLVGPNLTGTMSSTDDGRLSLPRQPIPRIKKHIDLDPTKFWADDNGGYSNLVLLHGSQTENFGPPVNYLMEEIHQGTIVGNNLSGTRDGTPTNNLSMPNENNSLTRTTVIAANTKARNFHQNIQGNSSNTNTNSTIHSVQKHIVDTNTSNSNKSAGSNQNARSHLPNYHDNQGVSKLRQCTIGMYNHASGPNNQEGQFPYNVIPPPKNKLDRGTGTPTIPAHVQNSAIIQLLQQNHRMRSNTPPEVLLTPRHFSYINGSAIAGNQDRGATQERAFYEWNNGNSSNNGLPPTRLNGNRKTGMISSDDDEDNSNLRHDDDIESQMSLPRSYTLPREFKYHRRARKMENFVMSNNSSDGDVDSVDENESDRNNSSTPSRNHNNLNCAVNSKNFYQNVVRRQPAMTSNFSHHNHHFPPANVSGRISVPAVGKYSGYNNQQQQGGMFMNGRPEGGNNYVHNLDLISSVMDSSCSHHSSSNQPPVMTRQQMRGRAYKGGGQVVRHETKL